MRVGLCLLLLLTGCTYLRQTFTSESCWALAKNSPTPRGLRSDRQFAKVKNQCVQIWVYSNETATINVYDSVIHETYEKEGAYRDATDAEAPAIFFVTFNGIETGYRHVPPANTVMALDNK